MSAPATSRRGWKGTMLVHDQKLYLLARAPRSKWWRLTCFCTHARKDGSCKQTDEVLADFVKPPPERVRVEHAGSDQPSHRVGESERGGHARSDA